MYTVKDCDRKWWRDESWGVTGRQATKLQKWRAGVNCSRYEQRQPGRFVPRQWIVEWKWRDKIWICRCFYALIFYFSNLWCVYERSWSIISVCLKLLSLSARIISCALRSATLTCCPYLVFALPLTPVVSVLQPLLSGTRSHLAFATLLRIPSVAFLKLTASIRLLAPPSSSPKCLWFSLWLTLCTLNIHLLTYSRICCWNAYEQWLSVYCELLNSRNFIWSWHLIQIMKLESKSEVKSSRPIINLIIRVILQDQNLKYKA